MKERLEVAFGISSLFDEFGWGFFAVKVVIKCWREDDEYAEV